MNQRQQLGAPPCDYNDRIVGVTVRTRHASYETADVPRYGVAMIADGFAVLAKANGMPTYDTRG